MVDRTFIFSKNVENNKIVYYFIHSAVLKGNFLYIKTKRLTSVALSIVPAYPIV